MKVFTFLAPVWALTPGPSDTAEAASTRGLCQVGIGRVVSRPMPRPIRSLALAACLAALSGIPAVAAGLVRDDLTGQRLEGADLAGADLAGALLWGTRLDAAGLARANLADATLRGASLAGADLRGADVSRASFRGATARGAVLRGARVGGASFFGADLRDTDWTGATGPALVHGADLRGARGLAGLVLVGDADTRLPGGADVPRCWAEPPVDFDAIAAAAAAALSLDADAAAVAAELVCGR